MMVTKIIKTMINYKFISQVHPKTPDPVQSMVVRDVTAVRVRHFCSDHDKHHHPRDEVPQPVPGI